MQRELITFCEIIRREVGVVEEKVELDDANMKATLHGLEGDIFKLYNVSGDLQAHSEERTAVSTTMIKYEEPTSESRC